MTLVLSWPDHAGTRAAAAEVAADTDADLRELASVAVGHRGTDVDASATAVRSGRLDALDRVRSADLNHQDDPDSGHALLELARSSDWMVRVEALCALARRRPGPEADWALEHALGDVNDEVRETALRLWTEQTRAPDAALPVLRAAARDAFWDNRVAAIELLRLSPPPDVYDCLSSLADDPAKEVRERALIALDTMYADDDAVRTTLTRFVCSTDDECRRRAWRRLHPPSGNGHGRPSVTCAADALVLAEQWGDLPGRAAELRRLLAADDHAVRIAALQALVRWSATDDARSVSATMKQDDCAAVRKIALDACVIQGETAAADTAMSDDDASVRERALGIRALHDRSPWFSAVLVRSVAEETDDSACGEIFDITAVRASAGLVDPADLEEAAVRRPRAPHLVLDWLAWLKDLPPLSPDAVERRVSLGPKPE